METAACILEGYTPETKFCVENRISLRTSARLRSQPDGLPYTVWGGKVYIPIEEARAWFLARVKRPNPRRKAA